MSSSKRWTGFAMLCLLVAGPGFAEEAEWPREITRAKTKVTIYQPQVESFEHNELQARAAVSVSRGGGAPEFGAIWIEAKVDTDRQERMVMLRDVKIPRVRFADASDDEQAKLAKLIQDSVPDSGMSVSLDLLIVDMDPSARGGDEPELKHDPPRIVYRKQPTVLVSLDGDPIYQKVEGAKGIERVLNTPFTMARAEGKLYLGAGGDLWYSAPKLEGPWTAGASPPAQVRALEPATKIEQDADKPPPAVLVVTNPTELIVSDGEPSWTPVEGMDLLYLDNTDSDVFLEVATQRYYVVLSGRWYRGQSIDEQWKWEHVPNDELPAGFAKIPADSTNGHVLPLVGGTPQARDAVLDDTIPQTAAIKRSGGTPITVSYDGKPKFEAIEGIPARYAVNTASAVFEVGSHYWACEQGVWYDAAKPQGPWKVATQVPEVLYRVPPSNPHYNVTYVRVYDVTPQVVYVGYTPGYYGSYVYSGCVVYGTGWYYRPWYGHYYYPRVPTWGFNVSYNPWTGWGFGVSWHNGPFSFSVGFGGGWFGPVGYRPWRRPYVGGGYRKTNIDIDRSVNIGDVNIDRSRRTNIDNSRNNVYNRGDNRNRVTKVADRQRPTTRPAAKPANRPNDVLTDRKGNVYRRNDKGGWDERKNRDWSQAKNLDRPSTRDGSRPSTRDVSRPSRSSTTRTPRPSSTRSQLERSHQSRARGSQRSQDFNRSRSMGGGRGGGGGGHRGGGRRR